jgi:hypothetical protein
MCCRGSTLAYLPVATWLFLACGCGRSIDQQFREQTGDTFNAQTRLIVAVEAFRLGSGRWPTSPQDLRRSSGLRQVLGFDRYDNLRFEPLPDGGLMVRFDRWHRRDGSIGMSNAGLEIPRPTDDDSPHQAQSLDSRPDRISRNEKPSEG